MCREIVLDENSSYYCYLRAHLGRQTVRASYAAQGEQSLPPTRDVPARDLVARVLLPECEDVAYGRRKGLLAVRRPLDVRERQKGRSSTQCELEVEPSCSRTRRQALRPAVTARYSPPSLRAMR